MHGVLGKAIIVNVTVGGKDTVGQLGNLHSRASLGISDELVEVKSKGLCSHPIHNCTQPAHTGGVRGHLRPEVTAGFTLRPNLRQHQPKDVGPHLSRMYQLHRRNDDTLLVNLTERTDTRRRTAAHIDMMGDIGDIAERLVVVVDGRNEGHIIEVATASIRVVDQEHIAWTEVFNPIVDDGLRDQLNQRPQVGGLTERLHY